VGAAGAMPYDLNARFRDMDQLDDYARTICLALSSMEKQAGSDDFSERT